MFKLSFDDFHYSPEEDSMASDDDAPGLHPARALPVDSAGQPEITTMIDAAFEHMGNSAWMQFLHRYFLPHLLTVKMTLQY